MPTLDFVKCEEFAENLQGVLLVLFAGNNGNFIVLALGGSGFF